MTNAEQVRSHEKEIVNHPGELAPQAPAGQRGFTLWMTGLSGAGKTTVCQNLEPLLRERGLKFETLDGDVIRTNLSKGLGFSHEDRDTNLRRIGFVCDLLTRNGIISVAAAISPYRHIRQEIRKQIQHFVLVHVDCPLEVCESRDVKGLYAKARAGKIAHFTGIDDPYEAPDEAEIVCRTSEQTPQESAQHIIDRLVELGYLEG